MRAFAPYLSRTERLSKWQFARKTAAMALVCFAVLWLGSAALALMAGTHPGELIAKPPRSWPALAAIWYGACGAVFIGLSTNLFFNRLNETTLLASMAWAVWLCFGLGLVSCADMALALEAGRQPNAFYWEALWGLIFTLLSFARSRNDGARQKGRPQMTNQNTESTDPTLEDLKDEPDWVAAATQRIRDRSTDAADQPQSQPVTTRSAKPANAPAFGRRKSLTPRAT